ncbi:peptidase domain-containing ABC transporter [Leptolyngbya sp. AN02str]|uniref:peptidase domain-containing ABC transporter n=1 Tax=Leptolyngbya sp. AN02str TaxID=3423363 RepID=UPI003D31C535
MTYTRDVIQEFLATVSPFDQLSPEAMNKWSERFKLLRYRMGQAIVVRDRIPGQIAVVYQGQGRQLGYDPRTKRPVTLELMRPGAVIGWVSLLRGIPCETVMASVETVCLVIEADDFLAMLQQEPVIRDAFSHRCGLVEAFDLLGEELNRQADGNADLKELTLQSYPRAEVRPLRTGFADLSRLSTEYMWLVSSGNIPGFAVGSRLYPSTALMEVEVLGDEPARLIGLPLVTAHTTELVSSMVPTMDGEAPAEIEIPTAPERPPEWIRPIEGGSTQRYPFVRGRNELEGAIACFQMLCQHFNIPFRRDIVRRVLVSQMERTGGLGMDLCGAVAELIGLTAQLVAIPSHAIARLEVPALVKWQNKLAVVYRASEKEMVMAVPDEGIVTLTAEQFANSWGEQGEVLLLRANKQTPQKRFGLSWFWPAIQKHKRVLIEVFVASFFVQLFALANPLMIQVIIDKVIVQNSIETLQVLGVFLLVIAVFEAVLGALRTYLFVDTTNRIDMALGSEIIDHLLRLPLRYFEKRPVGELATRINELENIRSFLTGTALTVVLDAVFSVIYIIVMFIYSWQLTLVALATIPLFVVLAVVASPIIRNQLRAKAERNAETQSYLVEVVGGIQTVKAQNLELRSRWQWQDRYARYVSAGFKTVLTSTTAGSASTFLNQLSGLLVLWVGAYLVLQQELTLGQLIAFRIIAGYVTSPLLRLAQLWQNFQEVGLSIERLSDIVDSAPEADEQDRLNIPMPAVKGSVKYENVSFRFNPSGPLQLNNVSIEFEPGSFIGIVGQSGSGKSTLMKLLPRLYDVEMGRILIDGYDISKVELYSLRQQIGIVPQDTLLFDGTIQENIALNAPDASGEEIIEAAKVAAAHDFIMGLPNGYNTRVGERGASLSGGQRQRIAIARTVMQNPRLLILDEATSALDYDSERRVCLNLAEAFRGRTVFFITHRLSTIRNADLILMMDQGSVVEMGKHDELMSLKGRYYCLYQQQESQM